jgi:RNA polymerase sigma-70 factor (ECF subfamily)
MDSLSDEALMARVAVGQTDALNILVPRYRSRVYAVLLRATGTPADAEDLFQETWIRVARRANTFDPSRSLAPWVAGIATNLAIDWTRSPSRRERLALGDDNQPEIVSPLPNPEHDANIAQNRSRIPHSALRWGRC